jgi:hypothetical protein
MTERDFVQHAKSGTTMFSGTTEECKEYLRGQHPTNRKRLYVIHTSHLSVEEFLQDE